MRKQREHGFTLVELMVAIAIAAVVMAGIFTVYRSQQRSYVVQDQVAAMQQNLRAAFFFMAREIRMAACDPSGLTNADFTSVTTNAVTFTMDIRGKDDDDPPDGTIQPEENISYFLYDGDGDGDADDLGRRFGGAAGTTQLIAENIATLTFAYLDEDGAVTANTSEIRCVQVTLRAKTDHIYQTEKSKTLTTTIKCRNKGLGI